MEALLKEQELAVRDIVRILTNYKKLGKANFALATAEDRLSRLRDTWEQCRRLHLQLELKATPENRASMAYFTEEIYERAVVNFEAASDFFTTLIAALTTPTAPASNSNSTSDRDPVSESASLAQLPRIPLPTFSGRYVDWTSFSDLFESLVVRNRALDDVQRLHYLKGSLEGPAASAVSHLPVTAANFGAAWQILCERYANTRLIVGALLNDLFSIAPLKDDRGNGLIRLRDETNKILAQLRHVGCQVDGWDVLLVHMTVHRLDGKTRSEWGDYLGKRVDLPTYRQLDEFLAARIASRETIYLATVAEPSSLASRNPPARPPPPVRSHAIATTRDRCAHCGDRHVLFRCPAFRGMPVAQRREFVESRGCCFNCLRMNHQARSCPSASRCSHCGAQHHSLLHLASAAAGNGNDRAPPESTTSLNCVTRPVGKETRTVLLATAIVSLETRDGRSRRVRALLDQGSEATFVSEGLVQALRIPKRTAAIAVTGAGNVPIGRVRARVELSLRPPGRGSDIALQALVLRRISSYSPRESTNLSVYNHLRGLTFADPDPHAPFPIELIIGADYYGALLRPGLRRGNVDDPVAQETVFGWIVSGPCGQRATRPDVPTRSLHCQIDDVGQQLRRFWQLEEATPSSILSEEEMKCEQHFASTVSRCNDGRYIVRLPLRTERPLDLGQSRNRAVSMLRGVERRLQRDLPLEVAYRDFLAEYERLGHMEEAPSRPRLKPAVYLPHHPVVKRSEGEVRVRVVFNASSPTTNGRSLNDLLLPGPKLQSEVFAILLRWRLPRFAIKADIAKMYRQIRVHPDDADLQRILWRREPSQEPCEFRLTTVTYGTACAPYLAQRVLVKLAEDEGTAFPRAHAILLQNFYVDDVLFGADSEEEAVECRKELTELLHRGGFELSKWAANTPLVLTNGHQATTIDLNQDSSTSHPVLGVDWCANRDSFGFVIAPVSRLPATKRTVLSTIARLYDPLGWASPVVVKAKILLQELWLSGHEWDDPLPNEFIPTWDGILRDLPLLSEARVPRWFGGRATGCDGGRYELHGFADASARAYAAVVYLIARSPPGASTRARISLVASRTKVAPLKTVSIPRLELCAAALLARLLRRIADDIATTPFEIHAWSDSQVVLAWLSRPPSKWAVFVANRVGLIHEMLPGTTWRHVGTSDNPADCASRGMLASELIRHELWWSGPAWLSNPRSGWPETSCSRNTDVEMRVNAVTIQDEDQSPLAPLPGSVSSWSKLLRVTALCLRFVATLRLKRHPPPNLDAVELIRRARTLWLMWLQSIAFGREIKAVQKREFVGNSSPLRRLNPFLDE